MLISAHSTACRPAGRRGRSAAFSLVELLVVLAIITLLATLTLPALINVSAAKVRLTCQVNMKSIAGACHLFATESSTGSYPAGAVANPSPEAGDERDDYTAISAAAYSQLKSMGITDEMMTCQSIGRQDWMFGSQETSYNWTAPPVPLDPNWEPDPWEPPDPNPDGLTEETDPNYPPDHPDDPNYVPPLDPNDTAIPRMVLGITYWLGRGDVLDPAEPDVTIYQSPQRRDRLYDPTSSTAVTCLAYNTTTSGASGVPEAIMPHLGTDYAEYSGNGTNPWLESHPDGMAVGFKGGSAGFYKFEDLLELDLTDLYDGVARRVWYAAN